MSLITLFSAPKAFTDPATALSQRNAISSWKQLADVEVLLLGQEDGLAQAAHEIGVRHSADVEFNSNRVPLISSMLRLARESGDSPLLCIVNADIILMSDFVDAARQAAVLASGAQAAYLLLSRRWDLDVKEPFAFTAGWESRLRQAAHDAGQLHRPTGSDLFLFPRLCYTDVPDFAIGRAGWDNWMIYKARTQGWPVIDATPSMTVIHQSHDYRHLPGARPHYDHPDTLVNTKLAGGQAATRYSVLDATHLLTGGRLVRPAMSYARFMRGVELLIRRLFFFLPEEALENIARPKRWNKRLKRLFGKTESRS
jgi:hypothetical protein